MDTVTWSNILLGMYASKTCYTFSTVNENNKNFFSADNFIC